ncbi:unnamed protein product [Blepharisma stoltei]|uniref:Protein disulfide-isomerase n=1 Tax=Blepharisma stoltei TaxID=1481888 RepID=A0AAU9K7R2_9CILI|nr:unnamed protein product [Blepharisma stoltei]
MALNICIAFLVFSSVYSQETLEPTPFLEIPEEEDVWVLTDSNFEDALNLQPNILIDFYAPWCDHCKKLDPEYAKAALRLKENSPSIRIAKVDATTNKLLADKYQIRNYPTIKYFENKKPTDYDGGRTEDLIVSWVLKKNGQTYTVIKDYLQLQNRIEKAKIVVVLFAQADAPEIKHFDYVSKQIQGVEFIVSIDSVSLTNYEVEEPSLVLFKQFDERRVNFSGKLKHADITRFIEKNMRPIVSEFNDDSLRRSWDNKTPAFFLLCNQSDYEQYRAGFYEVAKKYNKTMIFFYADLSNPGNSQLKEYLGLEPEAQPVFLIVDQSEVGNRFMSNASPTEENMKSFIKRWKKKEIEPTLKSQDLPENDYYKNLRVLVGKNFNDIVFDKSKDVLVYFYSPRCSHCREFEPIYQELAKDLSHIPTLILAKIDYTQNEVKDQTVSSFPTIRYFPGKKKKGIDFEGERTSENLLQFIKDKASFKFDENRADL